MPTYRISYVREKVSDAPAPVLQTPQAAGGYAMKTCFPERELWRERVVALYLDAKNKFLGFLEVSVGGSSSVSFDTMLVCRGAVDTMARKVILAHNHPSGNVTPSQSDIRETERAKRALSTLGIQLADHLILGEGNFFSFSDEVIRTL